MNNRINKYKYPGAKRLMLEAQELKDKTEDYCAQPIDDNLFEWHFTVRGPPETAFEGGFYHGRLSFPTEYPMKPPSIILLTPNGRFETNKKICLSISGYHPETWQPSWSVRTALLALIAFMPTKANRAIGSLDFSDAERKKLAKNSRTWRCETCGPIRDLLKHPEDSSCNNNECEPSTSRFEGRPQCDEQQKHQQDRKSVSSDCDGENRDSSTDSQKSSTSTNGSDSDGGSSSRSSSSSISSSSSSSSSSSNRVGISDSSTTATSQVQQQQQSDSTNEDSSSDDRATTSKLQQQKQLQQQLDQRTSSETTLTQVSEQQQHLNQDGRRSYPPLVFISISILLFLLILRRIVMMVQA